jgi:PilZ domain
MIEQRRELRSRCLREGRIIFNNRNSVLSCIVRDMSGGGVRITLERADAVPGSFQFHLKGAPSVQARKVWTRVNELGVSFV